VAVLFPEAIRQSIEFPSSGRHLAIVSNMKQAKSDGNIRFRPQRFPALQSIVEVDVSGPSLVDKVVDHILAQIIGNEISAGTRIKSTQLAKKLGVSRTPVAMALAKLSADGILLRRNNYQAELADGAAEWLVNIHKLRELVEPEAAAMAAGHIADDVLDDLWVLAQSAKPSRSYDWTHAAEFFDFALHLSIAEFCGNLAIKTTIKKCWSYKRLSYAISEGCKAALKPEYNQHLAILGAVAKGNADMARELMLIHIQTATVSRFADRIV
jgi:DNA-binding GntR family transcriptional regulator